ncbi:PPE family protein [Mycobacterium haemophilum]|uniref:PPE family protein n=1 Tax=Mycobacterium haemophilum TaxID=29311 RepID=A0A0I9U471_9MYCO|nr:PPE family protein [Mycobacterium haemophilum]KLO32665.1 PPE family protein [Mycobacterium haemophilum]KLO36926.1 PPE family protein [Mycobacterium haemophilum]KLO42946.1 PPE family protein [Mycobacterium haemophilum]KLO55679.1 PPE family protein [Mycobacterium haemophilum]
MTAALDFATLPPEINSARMYAGAGSTPLLAAASAWRGLAVELRSTALSYGLVLTALTSEEWHGPAAASMAAAARPYLTWMSTAAGQAEQTAVQAEAAAGAYESAFVATVPPPAIAANRAQLVALTASNVLGQNTPAIAATEAQYAEMWAQDAMAMYGYAGTSAAASRLSQFAQPQQNTSPSGLIAQSAAVAQAGATSAGTQQSTLSQLMSALPTALQGLASPASSSSPTTGLGALLSGLEGWNPFAAGSASETTGLNGLLNLFSSDNTTFGALLNSTLGNTIFSSGFFMPSNTVAPFLSLLGAGTAGNAAGEALGDVAASGIGNAMAGPLGGVSGLGGFGGALSAGLGHAPVIGALSVPPSWTTAAPATSPLASTLGATPLNAPSTVATGLPGMPLGSMGGQSFGRAVPQYGFRPTFVARPPAAG